MLFFSGARVCCQFKQRGPLYSCLTGLWQLYLRVGLFKSRLTLTQDLKLTDILLLRSLKLKTEDQAI